MRPGKTLVDRWGNTPAPGADDEVDSSSPPTFPMSDVLRTLRERAVVHGSTGPTTTDLKNDYS